MLCLALMGVTHHGSVNDADAVVTHIQRCQVFPHGYESCNRTAGLHPFRLPLRELACLRDQDRLETDITHATQLNTQDTKHTLKYCNRAWSEYHHRLCWVADAQGSQTRPERRQTLNLLRAALTDLRAEEEKEVDIRSFLKNI